VVVTRHAKHQSDCHHQHTNTQLTGWLPFLLPNQQCPSTSGRKHDILWTSWPNAHLGSSILCFITKGFWSGMGSRQFCQGRGQGREVEAEVRQGSSVLNWGKAEAESSRPRQDRLNSRQGRGEAEWNQRCLCRFDIMHNAYVVVTCSCFVVNDIYQWKTLQRIYKTEPRPRQKLWGRAEAEAVWSRPRQDRVRPRRGRAS